MRCRILAVSKRGANRCESEALDPDSSLPMCARHLAEATREYCRLTGGKLGVIAGSEVA